MLIKTAIDVFVKYKLKAYKTATNIYIYKSLYTLLFSSTTVRDEAIIV